MRILISGSHGLVGKNLSAHLLAKGHEVLPLIRENSNLGVYWDPSSAKAHLEDFENFDAIIHLAGKSIASGYWTKKLKRELFTSRVRDTWFLTHVISRLKNPPKTYITASALGYYGNRPNEKLTEDSPQGQGFLSELCQKWEDATKAATASRKVHCRFGIILSEKGGMLSKLLPVFRLGLGAIIGNGQQQISYIALDDVTSAIEHCLNTQIEGPVNFCTPNPETMESFCKKLAAHLKKPLFLKIPATFLKWTLGEMADEMLLASVHAYPKKLLDSGYSFLYPTIDDFLKK